LSEIILTISGVDHLELYGEKNSKLNLIKKAFPNLNITSRGENLKLVGEKKDTQRAKSKVEQLVKLLRKQDTLSMEKVKDVLNGNLAYELEQDDASPRGSASNPANVIVHGKISAPSRPAQSTRKNWSSYQKIMMWSLL